MILATASVIRGHENRIPDGLVLAVAALLYACVGYLTSGWFVAGVAWSSLSLYTGEATSGRINQYDLADTLSGGSLMLIAGGNVDGLSVYEV